MTPTPADRIGAMDAPARAMSAGVSFREFNAALRSAAFQKEYSSRAGGCRVDSWKRQENEQRVIIVQLWGDGKHRATHSINSHETTHPTDFTDVNGMLAAITVERERADNRKLMESAAADAAEGRT